MNFLASVVAVVVAATAAFASEEANIKSLRGYSVATNNGVVAIDEDVSNDSESAKVNLAHAIADMVN